jgi:hypothetical protein
LGNHLLSHNWFWPKEKPRYAAQKQKKLEKTISALETIQPTSTSSERTFSVAGSFSTKVRN